MLPGRLAQLSRRALHAMRAGIIRTPTLVDLEQAAALELSGAFSHPSTVPLWACLSVVGCLAYWCMRCDCFKARRKSETRPLLSCGDGSDPWEGPEGVVQIGVPGREFVRISTLRPCSGV